MIDQNGLSSYYSNNVKKEEAEKVTKILEKHNISPLNTRLIKLQDNTFELLIAST
jgi:hypothetical protein